MLARRGPNQRQYYIWCDMTDRGVAQVLLLLRFSRCPGAIHHGCTQNRCANMSMLFRFIF